MRLDDSYHSAHGQPEEKGTSKGKEMSERSSFIVYCRALHLHRLALEGWFILQSSHCLQKLFHQKILTCEPWMSCSDCEGING